MSQVLLTGPETPNAWATKLALKELVLRQALNLHQAERQRYRLLAKRIEILSPGKCFGATSERPLRGIQEAFPPSQPFRGGIEGAPIEVVAAEIVRWFQAGGGFVNGEVLPELERRALYHRAGSGSQIQWQPTEMGEARLAELRELIEVGRRDFPIWVFKDRPRGIKFINHARTSLLLVGNPAPWLWTALTLLLSGNELEAGAIPSIAPYPFSVPPDESDPDWKEVVETEVTRRLRDEAIERQSEESPGEVIDSAFGDAKNEGGKREGE